MPWRRSESRSRLWLDSEPLCTRQRSRPVENGCECSVVTALSVAMRVWPTACEPWKPARSKAPATSSGRPFSLKISMVSPMPIRRTSGWRSASALRIASRRGVAREHAMARPHLGLDSARRASPRDRRAGLPGVALVRMVQRELDRAAGGRRPIDREARAVRARARPCRSASARARRRACASCRASFRNRPTMPHIRHSPLADLPHTPVFQVRARPASAASASARLGLGVEAHRPAFAARAAPPGRSPRPAGRGRG